MSASTTRSVFIEYRREPIEVRVECPCTVSQLKVATARVLSDLSLLGYLVTHERYSTPMSWGLIASPYAPVSWAVYQRQLPEDTPAATRRMLDPRATLDHRFFDAVVSHNVCLTARVVGAEWPYEGVPYVAPAGYGPAAPVTSAASTPYPIPVPASSRPAAAAPAAEAPALAAHSGAKVEPQRFSKLATGRNMRDFEGTRVANCSRIAAALGLPEVTAEIACGPEEASKALCERGFPSNPGEAFWDWYLAAIAKNLEAMCKDKATQEALRKAISGAKVVFRVEKKDGVTSKGGRTEFFEGGALVVSVDPSELCLGIAECCSQLKAALN